MSTEAQINANRENGKKGGPNTPAGRDAVRYNALKHGLSAHHPVIPRFENIGEFNEFLNDLRQEVRPAGMIEHMLVDQIADAYWRRQRISRMEAGMFDLNDAKYTKGYQKTFKTLSADAMLHRLAEGDAHRVDMLSRYYRHDARFERSFFRAWKELKCLQAARKAETAPEAPETVPELAEPEAPETAPQEFAKQTQIQPVDPAPTPKPGLEAPEKRDLQGVNDNSTM